MIKAVESSAFPKPVAPYSHGIRAGSFLFVSGQLPLDPKTGQVIGSSIEVQARQVLDNVEGVLKAAGLDWTHVVKTEIFLIDLNEFGVVNGLYGERVSHEPKPARQTVQVARLPLDVRIEISCIAVERFVD